MIPRKELESLLHERLETVLGQSSLQDLLEEVQRLDEGWEEIPISHAEMGYSLSVNCPDFCWLAEQIYNGEVFKFYRMKKPSD